MEKSYIKKLKFYRIHKPKTVTAYIRIIGMSKEFGFEDHAGWLIGEKFILYIDTVGILKEKGTKVLEFNEEFTKDFYKISNELIKQKDGVITTTLSLRTVLNDMCLLNKSKNGTI